MAGYICKLLQLFVCLRQVSGPFFDSSLEFRIQCLELCVCRITRVKIREHVVVKPDHNAYQDERSDCENNKAPPVDRKSTRLNSSHSQISYAVFCLKKKNC